MEVSNEFAKEICDSGASSNISGKGRIMKVHKNPAENAQTLIPILFLSFLTNMPVERVAKNAIIY